MGIFDIQILFQTILYFCAFITGFVISIPIGVNRIDFKGQCILYSEAELTNISRYIKRASIDTNCSFPIYLSVFVCIFYGLAVGIYNGFALYKSTKDPTIGSQMWVMPFTLVNSLVTVVMLVSSCMISIGFSTFCDSVKARGDSCNKFENTKWTNREDNTEFDSGPYFKYLTVAQTASWTSFLIWVCQVALGILRLVRNRRLRSQNMSFSDKDTKPIATVEPAD
ncbi:hypothetical protein CHS0354_004044 [Potamilus streckersoni]|uniref:Transmembrane protein 179 n=1 Tax=Potamilus streckersoni TaxID=2493646 RepID=A0AAE0W9K4_9BIVA|nr:hypothetical protein CHS0354_004044 [Potamilus streckersoni]